MAVDDSPCLNAANITQDRLEPLLRERATELGADVRMGTRLLAFTQTEDGVTARLQDPSGHEYTLQAAYLVAADGHRSPVREALGIRRHGHGHLRTSRSVLFRAPLEPYLERGFVQFAIDQPDLQAGLITYGDGRWVLFLRDETDEDDEAALRAMIFKAIGRSDLELEVITTGRFEVSALVAERFSSGRVLLAGDAAHALPPNRAGYGANTGIEDAHNLAWKLAAVAGSASADLLETYDAERRPIAWLRYGQLFAREDFAAYADEADKAVALIDDRAMEFGQLYRSGAVLGASAELSPARPPEAWAGQPGTRAPHLWLWQAGERRSTLDLFGRDWVLLYEDDRWTNGAQQAGRALGLTLRAVRLGVDAQAETPRAFRTAFGVSEGGASLVRPDGYVAWRAPGLPTDPARSLTDALRRVSFATGLKSCDKPRVDAT